MMTEYECDRMTLFFREAPLFLAFDLWPLKHPLWILACVWFCLICLIILLWNKLAYHDDDIEDDK